MKFINAMIILLIMSTTFCAQNSKTGNDEVVEVKLNYGKTTKYLPFTLPSVIVKPGGRLVFNGGDEDDITFVIPKSDILFDDDQGYSGFFVGNTKFLIIPVAARERSKTFRIRMDTFPGRYPYAAYSKGEFIEGESSPEIIVEP